MFNRRQILILSYDEVLNDPAMVRERIEKFVDQSFPVGNNWKETNKEHFKAKSKLVPCSIQRELDILFRPHNDRLYKLLEANQRARPKMEQYPFPKFKLGPCKKDD